MLLLKILVSKLTAKNSESLIQRSIVNVECERHEKDINTAYVQNGHVSCQTLGGFYGRVNPRKKRGLGSKAPHEERKSAGN